jgi:hypothetical protein
MAHPDLEKLLNALLPFAQQMLEEYGEFHPFGASMQNDGAITMIGAKIEGEEFPAALDLIEILENNLRQEAEKYEIKGSGICFDVRVIAPGETEKTDAVQVSLEHSEAAAVNVFLPYKKSSSKKVNYYEIFATARDPKIFTRKTQ